MQLFRQQAIDHQHRLYGEVLLVQPLRWSAISLLLLGLTATFALFLTLGTYGRTIAASGVIRSADLIDLKVRGAPEALIRPGQAVLVTLSDVRLRGTVEQVSPTADGQRAITARLDPPSVAQRANGPVLQPGMPVDARIMLARRSFLQWLVAPAGASSGQ